MQKQWQLRLERARYEVERARRQYEAAEPENHWSLAGRLSGKKNCATSSTPSATLRELAAPQTLAVTAEDREQTVALAQDLPPIWSAPRTTAADRKQLPRPLIDRVLLDNGRQRGQTWLQINCTPVRRPSIGARRRVRSYTDQADGEQIEKPVRTLHAEGMMDAAVATTLNAHGFRTSHGQLFRGSIDRSCVYYGSCGDCIPGTHLDAIRHGGPTVRTLVGRS